jgi:imidazolonepropionase-like amidohydrolase
MEHATALRNVHLFTGTQTLPQTTVVFQDGIITALGDEGAIPPGAAVMDGAGHTLLPGLIDAHTHVLDPANLRQALIFGVTTELDMFTDARLVRALKEQQAAGHGLDLADLRSAGTGVTAPGGHFTEYGLPLPTITGPEEAQEFVDARIAEGSDYIKLVYDDGRSMGRPFPTISKETMAAVVAAAHRRGKLALVHITAYQDAREAIEVGVDALAHLFVDQAPDPDFARTVAEHHAFVVPTLTILECAAGTPGGASLVTDARLVPYLTRGDIGQLEASFLANRSGTLPSYAVAVEALRQLKAAHVPLLAGTDAPNPGVLHGASLHRELALLVQAGLTPEEALAAATSLPATHFGLTDRGRIAVGLRADLLLVRGDPTTDITATREIVSVWKCGVAVDRQAYREGIEDQLALARSRPAPAGSASGLVSDFEDGTMTTSFGSGWQILADSGQGGSSTAECSVVSGGANGSTGSLLITGEISAPSWTARAGAIFFPGFAPWEPANLSSKKALSFWAKGDGKAYRVMLLVAGQQAMPQAVTFVAEAEWQPFTFAFAQFGRVDGLDLVGVLFTAGMSRGRFAFQIDDVRFLA